MLKKIAIVCSSMNMGPRNEMPFVGSRGGNIRPKVLYYQELFVPLACFLPTTNEEDERNELP